MSHGTIHLAQVSDNGTILPRKLTGVQLKKQKRIARAIKRAQQLALMPKIWKLPQYRRAPPFPRPLPVYPCPCPYPTPYNAPQRETVEVLSRSQVSRPPPISHPSPSKHGLS